jgi:hypothetical protein
LIKSKSRIQGSPLRTMDAQSRSVGGNIIALMTAACNFIGP